MRDYTLGGKHVWGGMTHAYRSGRGIFGCHWECANPHCKYYDQACLWDTIHNEPPCCQKCVNCGDYIFNNRATCPNAGAKDLEHKMFLDSLLPKEYFDFSNPDFKLVEVHGRACGWVDQLYFKFLNIRTGAYH